MRGGILDADLFCPRREFQRAAGNGDAPARRAIRAGIAAHQYSPGRGDRSAAWPLLSSGGRASIVGHRAGGSSARAGPRRAYPRKVAGKSGARAGSGDRLCLRDSESAHSFRDGFAGFDWRANAGALAGSRSRGSFRRGSQGAAERSAEDDAGQRARVTDVSLRTTFQKLVGAASARRRFDWSAVCKPPLLDALDARYLLK